MGMADAKFAAHLSEGYSQRGRNSATIFLPLHSVTAQHGVQAIPRRNEPLLLAKHHAQVYGIPATQGRKTFT